MWKAGLQPESIGSTSIPKASSEDTAHWRRWWRLTGTAHLFLCPSGPPCCWVYNKTPQIPNHSPAVRPPLSHPWPVCPPYAQHSHGHHRALERKQRRASQALVSWIYFGFFFRCRWLFSQNTLQQTKTGIAVCRYIAGTGSAFSTSPGGQPWSFLSPVGIHHLLLFFFFPLFTFFLCVFFPLSPLYNTSPSFLQRKGHWLWASRLQKSSRTRGLVSSSRLAADLVEIVFQLLFLLQK